MLCFSFISVGVCVKLGKYFSCMVLVFWVLVFCVLVFWMVVLDKVRVVSSSKWVWFMGIFWKGGLGEVREMSRGEVCRLF